MKKTLKAILCMALCAVMLLSMASCGAVKKEEIVGDWSGDGGTDGGHSLTLGEDGKFMYVVVNTYNDLLQICVGEYEIDGNKIKCFAEDSCASTKGEHYHNFTYKNGKLTIGKVTLSKDED